MIIYCVMLLRFYAFLLYDLILYFCDFYVNFMEIKETEKK